VPDREPQNVAERAIILARGGALELPLAELSPAAARSVNPDEIETSAVVPETMLARGPPISLA
jgi:hypothetical protein